MAKFRFMIFILVALLGAASADKGAKYRGFKTDAVGKSGTASISGVEALFLNPAGLAGLSGGGVEGSFDIGLNSVLMDYITWATNNSKDFSSPDPMDSLLAHMGPVQNKWAPFSNSFYLQGHYHDFAFSIVEDIRYNLSLSKAIVTPVPGVGVLSDFQVAAGRGFATPRPEWTVGFSVKYLYRIRFVDKLLGPTDEEFYTIKEVLQKKDNSIGGQLDKIGVAETVADVGQGFGLNLGAMRQFQKGWSGGVSLLDFPHFYNGGFIFPGLNLGGAYVRPVKIIDGMGSRVVANLDWQIPWSWEPWYKQVKFGAGLEARHGDRIINYIGLGINDGYPSFGFRVGYVVYLSYLYIAEENGSYPGQNKLSFHKIKLDFSF